VILGGDGRLSAMRLLPCAAVARTADLLFTIWRQAGHWREVGSAGQQVRAGRLWSGWHGAVAALCCYTSPPALLRRVHSGMDVQSDVPRYSTNRMVVVGWVKVELG
jgi:hypothetical protein